MWSVWYRDAAGGEAIFMAGLPSFSLAESCLRGLNSMFPPVERAENGIQVSAPGIMAWIEQD